MDARLAGGSSEQQRVREKTGENSPLQKGPRSAAPRKQRENFKVTDTPSVPKKPESSHTPERTNSHERPESSAQIENRGSGSHYQMEVNADLEGQGSLTREKLTKLWRYRPFTRVVKGYRAYKTVRDYIQLNEKEAIGEIPYRKRRLKGLSASEWDVLWS